MNRPRSAFGAALAVAAVLALAGCGQRGPLSLPSPASPPGAGEGTDEAEVATSETDNEDDRADER